MKSSLANEADQVPSSLTLSTFAVECAQCVEEHYAAVIFSDQCFLANQNCIFGQRTS